MKKQKFDLIFFFWQVSEDEKDAEDPADGAAKSKKKRKKKKKTEEEATSEAQVRDYIHLKDWLPEKKTIDVLVNAWVFFFFQFRCQAQHPWLKW